MAVTRLPTAPLLLLQTSRSPPTSAGVPEGKPPHQGGAHLCPGFTHVCLPGSSNRMRGFPRKVGRRLGSAPHHGLLLSTIGPAPTRITHSFLQHQLLVRRASLIHQITACSQVICSHLTLCPFKYLSLRNLPISVSFIPHQLTFHASLIPHQLVCPPTTRHASSASFHAAFTPLLSHHLCCLHSFLFVTHSQDSHWFLSTSSATSFIRFYSSYPFRHHSTHSFIQAPFILTHQLISSHFSFIIIYSSFIQSSFIAQVILYSFTASITHQECIHS